MAGLIVGVVPTAFDVFLLILIIIKVLNMKALSDSHPSSPIVCVVLDFDFWLKLINLDPPRCAHC